MKKLSGAYDLNLSDGGKILKSIVIAGLGALAVVGSEYLFKIDFGNWTPLAVALGSVLINTIKLWLRDNTTK